MIIVHLRVQTPLYERRYIGPKRLHAGKVIPALQYLGYGTLPTLTQIWFHLLPKFESQPMLVWQLPTCPYFALGILKWSCLLENT